MNNEELVNLYKLALDRWGVDSQVNMAFQECAELIKALTDFYRDRNTAKDIIEEVVDVELMCGQMRNLYDPNDFYYSDLRQKKIARFKELLAK